MKQYKIRWVYGALPPTILKIIVKCPADNAYGRIIFPKAIFFKIINDNRGGLHYFRV